MLPWAAIGGELDDHGFARIESLLTPKECDALVAGYGDDARYRSTVVMERHNFGRGEYRYFKAPLPPVVADLRAALYARLAPLAGAWSGRLGIAERYPATLEEFTARCAAAGQRRPTPLVLRYRSGDYNALHQDLYGDLAFPLQVTVYLSAADAYQGGETVLAFGRPRAQTVARVLRFERGDALVFPNAVRPAQGAKRSYRQSVRHGVSLVTGGERFALGIVFHDAR